MVNKKGFTLIELLVVAAIITMVGSVAFLQFRDYRARARDVEREQEMKELQKALALYAAERRTFPVASGALTGQDPVSRALLEIGALQQPPADPFNVGEYVYTYDSPSGQTYTLTYTLETDSIPGKSKGPQTAGP